MSPEPTPSSASPQGEAESILYKYLLQTTGGPTARLKQQLTLVIQKRELGCQGRKIFFMEPSVFFFFCKTPRPQNQGQAHYPQSHVTGGKQTNTGGRDSASSLATTRPGHTGSHHHFPLYKAGDPGLNLPHCSTSFKEKRTHVISQFLIMFSGVAELEGKQTPSMSTDSLHQPPGTRQVQLIKDLHSHL